MIIPDLVIAEFLFMIKLKHDLKSHTQCRFFFGRQLPFWEEHYLFRKPDVPKVAFITNHLIHLLIHVTSLRYKNVKRVHSQDARLILACPTRKRMNSYPAYFFVAMLCVMQTWAATGSDNAGASTSEDSGAASVKYGGKACMYTETKYSSTIKSYEEQGKHGEAAEMYEMEARAHKTAARLFEKPLQALVKAGDGEVDVGIYKKIVKSYGMAAGAYLMAARSYKAAKDQDAAALVEELAAENYEKAGRHDKAAPLYKELAMIYHATAKASEGIGEYESATLMYNKAARLYENTAQSYKFVEDSQENEIQMLCHAAECYKKLNRNIMAKTLYKGAGELYFAAEACSIYEAAGLVGDAKKILEFAAKLS